MDLKNLLHMLKGLHLLFEYLQITILLFLQVQQLLLLFRSTNSVLSKIDLTKIFPICGFLYGGSSNVNDEGLPLSSVKDNILVIIKVIIILNKITKTKIKLAINGLLSPTKNIVINDIIIGNLPLHGTKLLVKIAINLSLLESIIRHPVTPTQLQPNPIAIVKACFPHEEHLLNIPSKLKAILGK